MLPVGPQSRLGRYRMWRARGAHGAQRWREWRALISIAKEGNGDSMLEKELLGSILMLEKGRQIPNALEISIYIKYTHH